MRKFRAFLIIAFLTVIYIYACNILLLPSNIIAFEGEEVNLKTVAGIKVRRTGKYEQMVIQTSSENSDFQNSYSTASNFKLNLDLFGTIPVKQIDVNVIPRASVIPMGNLIGAKMYTSGVLVVGMSEIEGADKKMYKPYEGSGIIEGDRIVQIGNNKIKSTDDLIACVNRSNGESIEVKYIRSDKTVSTKIIPVMTSENSFKIGLWVRDAVAGVGTLSFYDPSTGGIAALGHGITDIDTGDIVDIEDGELVSSSLVDIKKGERGNPGELQGTINNGVPIGIIKKNTNVGIYGKVTNEYNLNLSGKKAYEVALRDEIVTGEAEVLCELEDGKVDSYKVEIQKIYPSNNYDNKSMLIKIKDEELIKKAGGIVQGMSGSPIIQNNKFIGVITNVLVSDPTTGYAVFGDLMVKQMKSETFN